MPIYPLFSFAFLATSLLATAVPFDFGGKPEALGVAARVPRDITLATDDQVWFGEQNRIQRRLVRVDLKTGKSAVLDLTSLGVSNPTLLWKIPRKDKLLAFTGLPPRFLEIDPEALTFREVSPPLDQDTYWIKGTADAAGTVFVGLFPRARLVSYDARSGKFRDYGTIAEDKRQSYLNSPVVSMDGATVYCPVGLWRSELWAVDAASGEKKQILPEESVVEGGTVSLFRGVDGEVYGKLGGGAKSTQFVCRPDRIELVEETPSEDLSAVTFEGRTYLTILPDGRLESVGADGVKSRLQTDYDGAGAEIFSLPVIIDGKLLGSTIKTAALFAVDLRTGKIENHGKKSSGNVQIYDILPWGEELILSSYTGGYIDRLPGLSAEPERLAQLSRPPWEQERPVQMALGADGAVYIATIPIKGQLGGTLTRLEPETKKMEVHRNIIPNQSILSVAALPDSPLLVGASGIQGGSSAVPSEKEAWIFFWDTAKREIVHRARPIPGATDYLSVFPLDGSRVLCLASDGRYAFYDIPGDKVTHTGRLDAGMLLLPHVNPVLVGPEREIVVFGQAAIHAVHPKTGKARVLLADPAMKDSRGFYATEDGTLYYGTGAVLYRRALDLAD